MHAPTESKLQRNGAKGFLSATNAVVRRYAVRGGGDAVDNRSRVGGIGDVHAGAALAVRKRPLSPWRPATALSDGPPPLEPRRSWPPGAPSDDRQGFLIIPLLLRGAHACSATPKAGTRPSEYLRVLLASRSCRHSPSCTALYLYSPEWVEASLCELPLYEVLRRSLRQISREVTVFRPQFSRTRLGPA